MADCFMWKNNAERLFVRKFDRVVSVVARTQQTLKSL